MGSTLEHGIYLPSEGEKNCYQGLAGNWNKVDGALGDIAELKQSIESKFTKEIVTELPTEDINPFCIYMILKTDPETDNVYDEWVYINNAWEYLGNTKVDMTQYYTKQEVNELPAVASGVTATKVGNYDAHIANGDIHVTASDKTKWTNSANTHVLRLAKSALTPSTSDNSFSNLDDSTTLKVGDKVMDTAGVLFEVTAIDTQNSTFSIGTALIDLAQDSDVVHKSGNEYITDTKTFGKGTLIVDNSVGSNVHGEIKLSGSRSGYIVADSASDGVFDNTSCGISILLQDVGKPLHVGAYKVNANGRVFADNTNKNPVLSITSGLIRTSVLVPENDTGNSSFRILSQVDYANGNPSKTLDVRFIQYDNANATSAIYSNDDGKTSLGATAKRWSGVYASNYYYGSNNVEFSTKFVTTDTAQTISGNKTFSSNVNVYNSDSTTDTANIILKNSKAERGSTTNIGEQNIFFLDKDNAQIGNIKCEVDANGYSNLTLQCSDTNDTSLGVQVRKTATGITFQPTSNNQCYLGQSIRKWYSTYTNKINGLEPSALGMPDLDNGIDISSYIDINQTSQYTAPANGYISICGYASSNNAILIQDHDYNFAQTARAVQTSLGSTTYLVFPVNKNHTYDISCNAVTNIQYAYFYPCQGNV